MANREKVISSLNKALTKVGYGDMDNVTLSEVEEAIESAISLLKEQEPIKPRFYTGYGRECWCGQCGSMMYAGDNYCSHCGRRIKWDD